MFLPGSQWRDCLARKEAVLRDGLNGSVKGPDGIEEVIRASLKGIHTLNEPFFSSRDATVWQP